MDTFVINLFLGKGISYNGELIKFPYLKLEPILLYILINKKADRDNLAAIFWSENDLPFARKNLRNAIYMLKKLTRPDLFIAEDNKTITLNPDIYVTDDIHDLKDTESDLMEFLIYEENFKSYVTTLTDKGRYFQSENMIVG